MNNKILAIIKSTKNNYLLLRTNPEWLQVDDWYVVTGSVEDGESFDDAVIREVKEETGFDALSISNLEKFFEYEWPVGSGKMHHEKAFLIEVQETDPVLSGEHLDYKWLPKKEFIEEIDWYSDKKGLEKMLEEPK